MKRNPISLEDWCMWYLICHLHEFCIEILALLPKKLRFRLLVNLPVVDIWRLEATSFGKGLDTDWLWEIVVNRQYHQYAGREKFMLHGKDCINHRSRYFVILWDKVYRDSFYSEKEEYKFFSDMLYSVPAAIGVDHFCLSRDTYHLPSAVPPDFQLHPATLQFFLAHCQVWPEALRIGCISFGMKPENATLLERTWDWHSSELFIAFSHFVAKFQVLKLVAVHDLYMYSRTPYRVPADRTDAQNLHRCLNSVPLFIMEALTANANYCLSSLMIETTTWDRCFQMLVVCRKYLSTCLQELCLSVRKNSQTSLLNLKVLPYISEILSTMGLHSFDLKILYKMSDSELKSVLLSEDYMLFISSLRLFIHQPSFQYLSPGFPLPHVFTQQLIAAFISNSCSHEQTLAISNVADISDSTTTVDMSNPVYFPNLSSSSLKSLELTLTPLLAEWFETLPSLYLNHLHLFGGVNELRTISKHIKKQNLSIKSLTVDVKMSHFESRPSVLKILKSAQPPSAISYVPLLTIHSIETFNFLAINVMNIFESLPLLTTAIREQAAFGTLRNLTLQNTITPISDGNLKAFSQFFDALFSLPHLSEFTLELTLRGEFAQAAHIIHSKWLHKAQNVRLAKFVVHHNAEVRWDPLEEISVRFIHSQTLLRFL